MRRGRWAADPTALWAASTEGVIPVKQLMALGVPERSIYRRCRRGGVWTRLLPGIVALQTGQPTRRQMEVAALLHGGPCAMLTGVAAARHHGLRRGPDPTAVHVLVPLARQVRSVGFVVVERTTHLPAALVRDGLRVAPPVRSLCDAVRRLKDPVAIAALLTEPVQRRMCRARELREELDSGSRRGTAAPRKVLRAVDDGVRSPAEFDARAWWLSQPGLPPIEWNVRIHDEDGNFVGIADGLVREIGFVWEIDSVEQHFETPQQVAETARKRRAYERVGLHSVSTRPSQQRTDPAGVRADVDAGLRTAAALPRARVTYAPASPTHDRRGVPAAQRQ